MNLAPASALVVAGSAILASLGALHVLLTFRGPKLRPRDPATLAAMRADSAGITRAASMWDFWIGFNLSHSLCAIVFGVLYGYLALAHPAVLFGSWFLLGFALATLASLLLVASRWWFAAPRNGIALTLACFVAAIVVR